MTQVAIRVYGSLNDFLPPQRRQIIWPRVVTGHPAVKDVIESLGVPHPEIDLVLANGTSISFDYAVQDGDRIAVFPRFMALDVASLTRVRPPPLDVLRFVVDVHLGALARRLRLVGLDTVDVVGAHDATLAEMSSREHRVLLTRDVALLKWRVVTRGYFVRSTHPQLQMVEVLRRFGPLRLEPLSRCLRCNGELREVARTAVEAVLPQRTRQHYDRFHACAGCGRIYWKGAHWPRLMRTVEIAQHAALVNDE
jgi:uncharacterized protein